MAIRNPNEWRPSPKQSEFLSIPYSIKEAFYAGAVMAGKSDVLLMYPLIHKWHLQPGFKGLFLRRTIPELKLEIIPRSKDYYKIKGIDGEFNATDRCWTFPSGARITFGHLETEDDVHIYDSMQINYCAFDELTSFTEWQYTYLTLQRVRSLEGSSLPAVVRSASNPGNIGHNWVRKRFIDPNPKGFTVIENKFGVRRIYIPATIKDNPYASEEYVKSLESLPEAEKQSKLYGNWSAYEGLVFDEFRDKKYPDEPAEALHVIDDFEIPDWWPKIVGIDWGFAPPAMTYICFAAISPDKRIYIYREMAWQKIKISQWTAEVKPYLDKEQPRVIKMCKSAGQDRGQEHTILQQVIDGLGHNVQLTTNSPGSRVATKMLLHEYLRWRIIKAPEQPLMKYDDEHASWLYRNRSLKEYNSYMESFKKKEPDKNLPKLLIFKQCPLLIQALKSCSYDKTNPQDVAEFAGDDPYDTLRYVVDCADGYFNDASSEFQIIETRNKLVQTLEQTGDMTAFYRNARALEASGKTKMIRRYH